MRMPRATAVSATATAMFFGIQTDIPQRLASSGGRAGGGLLRIKCLIESGAKRSTEAFEVRVTERIHSAFPSLALFRRPFPIRS